MAVIAIYSVKGGVGKTTIATNLAWCAATISCRSTLLWDLDPAGGAGFLLGMDAGERAGTERMFEKGADPDRLIRRSPFPRLKVLPADDSLYQLDRLFARIGKRKRLARLAEQLGRRHERIFLDCPPVLNEVSGQVIRAADCVIVPLPPSPLSARALETVVKEIRQQTKIQPPILPVLSMLDMRRTLHRETRAEHPDWPAIPFASAVEQCAVRQQPIGAFAPGSPAARSFNQLWAAIERKLVGGKS